MSFTKIYSEQLTLVEQHLLSLARAMPEDHYSFAPAAGMRTFAEQVRHAATMIYMTEALVVGERSPFGPGEQDNGPEEIRTKEELVRYLEDAFAYARRAVDNLAEQDAMEEVTTYFGAMTRAAVAAGIVFHSFDHYGQMAVYARLCGVVPPMSLTRGLETAGDGIDAG